MSSQHEPTNARAFDRTAVQVMMVRPTLDRFSDYPLPSPYTVRWYQPGDEKHWLALKARADHFHQADANYYEQTYGPWRQLLPGRQAFLCDGRGHPIGSTTAWFEDFGGEHYGKINWVFIVPEAQGKGLSKPLLSIVGQRLIALGHDKALLYTLTTRLPAIELYQRFGFVPCIRHDQDVAAWRDVNDRLRVRFDRAQYVHATAQ